MTGHYTCAVSPSELSPTFNLDLATTADGVVSVDGTKTHFEMDGTGQIILKLKTEENGSSLNTSSVSKCDGNTISLKSVSIASLGSSTSTEETQISFTKLSEDKIVWNGRSKTISGGVVETVKLTPTVCKK